MNIMAVLKNERKSQHPAQIKTKEQNQTKRE